MGLYGAFWIYSGVSIAGLFFVCCAVPETKGVELEEMHHTSITPSGQPTENHVLVPPHSPKPPTMESASPNLKINNNRSPKLSANNPTNLVITNNVNNTLYQRTTSSVLNPNAYPSHRELNHHTNFTAATAQNPSPYHHHPRPRQYADYEDYEPDYSPYHHLQHTQRKYHQPYHAHHHHHQLNPIISNSNYVVTTPHHHLQHHHPSQRPFQVTSV